jgi:hypothetical protein
VAGPRAARPSPGWRTDSCILARQQQFAFPRMAGGGGGRDEVRGLLFRGYSLRLRKPKQKASTNGRVKNHCRPLF